jgi:AraC-like DNA-binding protein
MSQNRQTAQVRVRALAVRYSDGAVLERHDHDWGQLVYASEGVMLVESAAGAWIVPPQRAVWVPPNVEHRVTMCGSVAMRTLYFAEQLRPRLDSTCVVDVSPLLRELVLHCVGLGKLDLRIPHEARLARLLVDLLRAVGTIALELPMPRDARALRVAEALQRDLRRAAGLDVLAQEAGASPRTVERLFVAETGMTFARWKQQSRLLAALRLLAEKTPVAQVALEVGYGSPSAFIAMFKSALGTTPNQFFS